MVYPFFTKWKELRSKVFSLKDSLILIDRMFKVKIRLHKKIWDGLNQEKVDFKNVARLLKLYQDKQYTLRYVLLLRKVAEISSANLLDQKEVRSFYEFVSMLSEKAAQEDKLAIPLLKSLRSGTIPEKSTFYELQDILRLESEFLQIEDDKFRAIEDVFLIKKKPGASATGYYSIFDAIKKGIISYDNNKLWRGEKPIQGVTVVGNKILLKGDHYAPLKNAQWVQGDRFVHPSLEDPYSYFVERGRLQGISSRKIQYLLGISNAEAVVSLEIEIFPEQLYIKVGENIPTHFAIAQLYPEQVQKVITPARRLAA